jgi:uncharacterized membrane protein (DUF485 family)
VTHSNPPEGPPEDSPEFHLPKDHWPLPELSNTGEHPHPPMNRYVATQNSAEYQKLRRSFRSFAFPVVTVVLVWYFIYVLLSIYATGFMKLPGWGGLNVGLWISLAQFPTTWFATWLYVRTADKKLDPMAEAIRVKLEAEEAKS